MKVAELMRIKPKTVHDATPIDVVWNLISLSKIHMLPVLDDNGYLKGIITAEDLLKNLVPDYQEFFSNYYPDGPTFDDIQAKLEKQIHLTAEDLMNTTVHTVYQDHDVFKALSRMLAYNKRILPVTDKENKLVGFIVEKDIFKYLFKVQKHILKKLHLEKSRPPSIKFIPNIQKFVSLVKNKKTNYFKILRKK